MINLSYSYPAFCLVSTKNVPIFAHDKKGSQQTRLKHDYLFICLLRQCRKCLTVGKGLISCLGKGSVLMGLHWLLLGQRRLILRCMHSDTCKFFIARLPYIYVSIREPLSYYRPGENLLSLQTLKFLSIAFFPLLLQNC